MQKARRPSFKRPNQSRWVMYAGNGRRLCNSGETYTNVGDCLTSLEESLGTITLTASDEVADRLYRTARGVKHRIVVGTIRRADGDVVVYDEVRI